MKRVLNRIKNLMIRVEGVAVVEYALLLVFIVVLVVVLVTLSLSYKKLLEKATCELNRAQAYEKSIDFHDIECPAGGIITLIDGYLYCSKHSAPLDDDEGDVPYLWNDKLDWMSIAT